jgi:hypothetical protein
MASAKGTDRPRKKTTSKKVERPDADFMESLAAIVGSTEMWLTGSSNGATLTLKEGFQRRMAKKLGRLERDRDRVRAPAPRVAGPLLAHYPFVADDESLRDLFENLLVTAMKEGTNAHPGFVEVLKQLNPDEARLLRALRGLAQKYGSELPYIDANGHDPKNRGFIHLGFICDLDFEALDRPDELPIAVGNLTRLGILSVDAVHRKEDSATYAHLESSELAQKIAADGRKAGRQVVFSRRILRIEKFGEALLVACAGEPA